jgi:hypothetical protein
VASQTFTVLSVLAEARYLPSALNATVKTADQSQRKAPSPLMGVAGQLGFEYLDRHQSLQLVHRPGALWVAGNPKSFSITSFLLTKSS